MAANDCIAVLVETNNSSIASRVSFGICVRSWTRRLLMYATQRTKPGGETRLANELPTNIPQPPTHRLL